MTPDDRLQLLTAAVDFVAHGYSIVPIAGDGTKRAAVEWKRWQTERPGQDELVDWFLTRQYEGFAIVCGAVSGNAMMIELEGRAMQEGAIDRLETLANHLGIGDLWDKAHGYVQLSPSGGQHWLIRCTDPVPGNLKLARRRTSPTTVQVLAETRGEGGYFIAAPSAGTVHPTGQPWVAMRGNARTAPTFTADELTTLTNLFRQLDEMPTPVIDAPKQPTTPHDGTRPGDDYNDHATWADILTDWNAVYTDSTGATYWRRPGKHDGISATTGRNDGDNLYVFTTSTVFDTEKAYSKFAAYTLLHHAGDYTAAAKTLAAQGWGTPTPANVTELRPFNALEHVPATTTDTDDDTSTWKPINLTPHITGTHITPMPSHLTRADGTGLLYAGRVHSFYGESESGKSWLAQIATAQALTNNQPVTYIDFEADAADIVDRLQLLGVPNHHIARNLTYIRPETPRSPDDPHWQQLLTPGNAVLVIIDGVTEALTMWGGETKDNDGITRWMRLFPRAIARSSGAAVVTIDHVTKNADTRGRFAIGGQAKLATIDGAAYLVEPIEAIAPGHVGALAVRVTKDRPGAVRRLGTGWRSTDRTQAVAVVQLDSTTPGITHATIYAPKSDDEKTAERRDSMAESIIQRAIAEPGIGLKRLSQGLGFRKEEVQDRIRQLIDDGMLVNRGSNSAFQIHATDDGAARFGGRGRLYEVAN